MPDRFRLIGLPASPTACADPGELAEIDALDTGLRGGPDPELLNTRTFPKIVDNS